MALSADELLKLADDIDIREVPLPDGKGTVFIRGLTGTERESWEASNQTTRVVLDDDGQFDHMEPVLNLVNQEARLVVRALCDANGKRLFGDHEAGKIGNLPSKVVRVLFNAARDLAGLAVNDDDAKRAQGNSDAAQGGASSSASPANSDAPSPNSSSEFPAAN